MKKFLKKIARRILRNELFDLIWESKEKSKKIDFLEQRNAYLEERVKNINKYIIPETIYKALLDTLPSPNHILDLKNTPNFRFQVSMTNNNEEEILINVFIKQQNNSFNFWRRCRTFRYNMMGIDSEVRTAYYDFSEIAIVKDFDVQLISEFINAQQTLIL